MFCCPLITSLLKTNCLISVELGIPTCLPGAAAGSREGGTSCASPAPWPHGKGTACTGKDLGLFRPCTVKGFREAVQIWELEKFCKAQERGKSNGLLGGRCNWDPFLTQICLSAWDKVWFVPQQLLIEELHFLRKRRSNGVILAKFVFQSKLQRFAINLERNALEFYFKDQIMEGIC